MWPLILRLSLVLIRNLTRPQVVDRLATGAEKSDRRLDDHLVELLRLGSALFHPPAGQVEPHGTDI